MTLKPQHPSPVVAYDEEALNQTGFAEVANYFTLKSVAFIAASPAVGSDLFGIEASVEGRFPQLLIGGQKDTSLWGVFAPQRPGKLARLRCTISDWYVSALPSDTRRRIGSNPPPSASRGDNRASA